MSSKSDTGAPHTLTGDAYLLQKLTQLVQEHKDPTATEILAAHASTKMSLRRLLVSPPPSRQPQSANFTETRDDIVTTGFRIESARDLDELIEAKDWERACMCACLAWNAAVWSDGMARRVIKAQPRDDPWLKILRAKLFGLMGNAPREVTWLEHLRTRVTRLVLEEEDLELLKEYSQYTQPSFNCSSSHVSWLLANGRIEFAKKVYQELRPFHRAWIPKERRIEIFGDTKEYSGKFADYM